MSTLPAVSASSTRLALSAAFALSVSCAPVSPSDDDDATDDALVFIEGSVTIDPSFQVDLESEAMVEGPTADLSWTLGAEPTRALVPLGFARLAPMPTRPSGPAACAVSMLSDAPVDGSGADFGDLGDGEWLCVHTQEGRFGAIQVTDQRPVDGASLPSLSLQYTLWDPPSVPAPAVRGPIAELSPWLDVAFGWESDFADSCAISWLLPGASDPARVDGPLPPDHAIDDLGGLPPLRWEEAWGNAVQATLTCERTATGRAAEHAFELTRPEPAAPAPAITSFTGEAVAAGDPAVWSAHLVWSTTDADSCRLLWFNPDDNDYFNDEDGFPTAGDELVWWREDYTGAGFDLVCTQAATGRSDLATITLTQPVLR